MKRTALLAAILLSIFSAAFLSPVQAEDCALASDAANHRPARPSEIQVLWSSPRLTYANTTNHYASCSFTMKSENGKIAVETFLKPGETITHRRVSGIRGNPANCLIYEVTPCDPEHRWDN
ncbi:hypothetical protein L598_003400000090 [Mesorhizobium sp. J18]|uniref:hypothetical protein n=1 Tax=Mesorhizobium sp. J18 TaxID=935263 RepID=UPI0011998E7C|nr:hypothetical protein [Mesorhizobium sp. J18]TWG94747.1 hypothetical protein L598_003400000090 [Mesorhizobium sp. J18]